VAKGQRKLQPEVNTVQAMCLGYLEVIRVEDLEFAFFITSEPFVSYLL
jgi:hypothetical protein